MEMRASQVIKGALGGGAKRKKVKDWGRNREREEEKKGERHLQIHTSREVWKLGCHSYLVTAVEQVSDTADLTSLSSEVVVAFCRLHLGFSSRDNKKSYLVSKKKKILVADWLKSTNRSSDIR